MVAGTQMAEVAALVGDPARASMLAVMMDGRAHTAGELALVAGVSAQTTSGHLARLLDRRLVAVAPQGRHRYYRLASRVVARMLESIMIVTTEPPPRERATPRVPEELREARTCYDHLAGRLGVAIADALAARDAIRLGDGACELTDGGQNLLVELGIDLAAARGASRRPLCRPCLDWSERRPHIAGLVGAALLRRFDEFSWVEHVASSRAMRVTSLGADELYRLFGYRTLSA